MLSPHCVPGCSWEAGHPPHWGDPESRAAAASQTGSSPRAEACRPHQSGGPQGHEGASCQVRHTQRTGSPLLRQGAGGGQWSLLVLPRPLPPHPSGGPDTGGSASEPLGFRGKPSTSQPQAGPSPCRTTGQALQRSGPSPPHTSGRTGLLFSLVLLETRPRGFRGAYLPEPACTQEHS